MRIAIVVPHIFMNSQLMQSLIFAPGYLAISLAEELQKLGHKVTLFTPGKVDTSVVNVTADLSLFEDELAQRGYGYTELLRKHPLTFISLARQLQSEIIANVYEQANLGKYDIVHVYANEEELALSFARFCKVPLVFTHHEPFNFLPKYRSIFPKYKDLNWISISLSQRKSMQKETNFVANIYHGINPNILKPVANPSLNYLAYFGRIIEPKGVHLAIAAAKQAGVKLKIAGKHYADYEKDSYWREYIEPHIDGKFVEYVGFISANEAKQEFLGNAQALLLPSIWEEPFGMVMIEAMACGTPVIGLDNGSLPEVIDSAGLIAHSEATEKATVNNLADAIKKIAQIDRANVRKVFEKRFSASRMALEHEKVYKQLISSPTLM